MVTEELLMIERIGIGAFAFVLVFLLLKAMIARSFVQTDLILDMAKNVIKENTKALEHMQDGLMQHIKQKDVILSKMELCKKERDSKFNEILRNNNNSSNKRP